LLALKVPRRRVAVNALAVLGLILGGVIVASGWLADARMTMKEPALVVAKEGAEMLSTPSNNSTPVLSLPQGATVDVLSPRGAWSYVDLNGAVRGWVQTERLEPLVPGESL
ncbi:SH3 domain-containing protein, partial [Corallococcus praedator]